MNLFLAKTFLVLLHLSITVSFAHPSTIHEHSAHEQLLAQAPTKWTPFPRSKVAVEGTVFCKSCKYINSDNLTDATPIQGALVKLECNNTKNTNIVTAETNRDGYYLISGFQTPVLTSYGSHKCKISLLSSPIATCNKTTNLHAGQVGSLLMPRKPPPATLAPVKFFMAGAVELFTIKPFAFEPSNCP